MATPFTYPIYLGDAEKLELDRALAKIVQSLKQRRADFLFGAGMSVASGVPAGHQLAVKLLNFYFPPTGTNPPGPNRLEELASEFPFEALVKAIEESRGGRRAELTNDLKNIFLDTPYQLNQAHNDFLSICNWGGRLRLNRIFTTNFDPLLENAFGVRVVPITKSNTRDVAEAQQNNKIPLIYLHGTLSKDNYQITESDIFDSSFNALHSMFRSALIEADAFVFVGYSMSDPDFRSLYLNNHEEMNDRKIAEKDTYVVTPLKDKDAYALGKGVWKSRGAVLIPLTAEAFFLRIRFILENQSDDDTKKMIMKKYNLKDEQAFQDKIQQTAKILKVEINDAIQFLVEARTKAGGKI